MNREPNGRPLDGPRPVGSTPGRGGLGNPGQQNAPQRNARQEEPAVDVTAFVDWIKGTDQLAKLGNQALVEQADKLGDALHEVLTTTQIRRILARVNALKARIAQQAEFQADDVPLLKVHFAYAAAREQKAVGPLAKVLIPAVDRIHEKADYVWFARFVEAVVAFHRFHGGSDN